MAYKSGDLKKQYYKTGEVAKMFNVTPRTIQQWEYDGIATADRTPAGQRMWSRDEIVRLLKKRKMYVDEDADSRRDVVYARVSTDGQKKKGDLDRQVTRIIENVPDLHNPLILKEVGSGLNDRRTKIQSLLKMVMSDQVDRIFVTHKERLTRFGFEYLKTICELKNVKIVVTEGKVSKSAKEELTEDIMMLIASFSGKFYGLRDKPEGGEREQH